MKSFTKIKFLLVGLLFLGLQLGFRGLAQTPASPAITAGSSTAICSGGSVLLTAAPVTATDLHYYGGAGTYGTDHWQSFAPTISGGLVAITIYTNGCPSNSATFTLYNGVGTAGSVLNTQTVNISGCNTSVVVNLPNINLTAGSNYTFRFQSATDINLSATYGAPGSYYANTYGLNPGFKLSFTTTMKQPLGSVQWFNNGGLIGGATANTYTATTIGAYTSKSYIAGNSSLSSNSVTVTNTVAPSITAGGPLTFCAPGSVTLNTPATPVTDISFPVGNAGTTGVNQWQSFVPTIDGLTTAIQVYIGYQNATETFNIYKGTGTLGTLLYSQPTNINAGPHGYYSINISGGIHLTPGTDYTFQLIGSSIQLSANTGNYGSYFSSDYGLNTYRLAFNTIVSPYFTPQWYNGGSLIAGATSASYTATTSGTYTCANGTTGCYSGASNGIAVMANTINTIALTSAAATNAQTVCSNTTINNITYSTTEATGATFSGLPAGVTGSWSSNVITISGTPTVSGTFSYTITLTGGCGTTTATGTITSNPIPNAVAASAAQTICNGTAINSIVLSGNVTGTVYSWTRDNTTITGIAASGTGNISGSLSNTTNAPVTVTFFITPSYTNAGTTCTGTAITAKVVVNPTPTVTQPTNQVVCSNGATAAVNFTGTVTGTNYSWTNDNISTGLATSGTGNIASFTATNTTNAPLTSTVTVTPLTGRGSFAYIGDGNTVAVINTATNTVVATVPVGSGPVGVSASADGSRVYVANQGSGTVSVINTASNTVVATVPAGSYPTGLWVSPDGSRVYVTNVISNNVSVINTATNSVIATVAVGANPFGVSVSPDGSRVYVANYSSNDVYVINTASNTVIATVAVGLRPFGVAVSPDGSRVYVANQNSGTVSVINTASNTVLATIAVGGGSAPSHLSISPDGSRIYATNYAPGFNSVSVINTATNTVVATVPVGTQPYGISVSPDGNRVYALNVYSNNISVINTGTNSVVATIASGVYTNTFGNFITPGSPTCTGTTKTFTITVNPTPTVNAVSNQTVCAGVITAQTFSGSVTGTVYNWTNSNTAIGLGASGSGNISFTSTNTTAAAVTATITVTPVYTNAGTTCNGTARTFTITVNGAPTITCPTNITVNNTPGQCGATVTYPSATASGSPTATITYSKASGSYFPLGSTVVTASATNSCGMASCNFTVTVVDNQAPTITCPANISVIGTSASGAVVTYTAPVGTDNCVSSTVRTAGLASGSTFPLGTTTVTHRVTDASGLTAQCSFVVTITGLLPHIVCPSNITVNNTTGQCGAIVNFVTTETVGIPASTITYSQHSGTFFPEGITTVTATATNAVGLSSCTFTVTVVDNQAPSITCAANQSQTADRGLCNAYVTVASPLTPTDNCGIATVTNNHNGGPTASGVYPVGTTTVIWTVTDIHGNTNTCSQTITVADNEAPSIACAANQTQTADAGVCTAMVTVISPSTSDNCGVLSVINSFNGTSNASGIYPRGTTSITWTVTDIHGNTSNCLQTITVTGNAGAVIHVPLAITLGCGASILPSNTGMATATDYCTTASFIITYTDDVTLGACGGTITRTWSATDASNNQTTATQTIIVTPATLPTMTAPAAITISVACGASAAPSTLPFTNGLSGGCLINGTSNPSTFTSVAGTCGGTLIETWTATDLCGRAIASVSRTVTVSQTLGTVQNFVFYSGDGAVSNTGASTITGDVGSNAGAVSGFSTAGYSGTSYTNQANMDLLNLYIHLCNVPITNTTHAAAFGSGETLTPGMYLNVGAGSMAGNLILDGQGSSSSVFIFKFNGAFAAAAGCSITLINGANAGNVFLIAEGALTIGAGSTMKGNFIAHTGAATMGAGGDLEGRMLSTVGAVSFGPGLAYLPVGNSTLPIVCVSTGNNTTLGSAADFTLFSSAGAVSNVGSSGFIGNVGSDAGAVTGFDAPATTHIGATYIANSVTLQAASDLQAAYTTLINTATTNSGHAAAFGGGETLMPGVYAIAGAGSLTGTLTLDGGGDANAIFIFKIGGAFSVAAQSRIILANGAHYYNVFWVAEGAISSGIFTFMKGSFIAHNGANSMGANGNLEGSLFSTAGAISFNTGVGYVSYVFCVTPPVEYSKANSVIIKSENAIIIDSKLSIFPNPTRGIINLVTGDASKVSSIEIVDVMGKLVYSAKHYEPTINLTNKAAGVYFIRVNSNSKITTTKIVVEK